MDLLLDLGHTRLKWAWWQDGRLLQRGAVAWQCVDPEILCGQLWADAAAAPDRVALAAVAQGALVPALEKRIAAAFGRPVLRLRASAVGGGVRNGYQTPAQLGVDRWAAMLGAWRREPDAAALVVDCGSALTVDLLDARGQHLGGVIAPGLMMAAEAFFGRTGRTQEAGARACEDGLATGTAEAVASGALFAAAGAITLMRTRAAGQGPVPTVWLTGGDAEVVAPMLDAPVQVVADLVFEGMAVMLDKEP